MIELPPIVLIAAAAGSAAFIGLVFWYGERMFRPTANRCPICERITGASADQLADNPLICGHDICPACLDDYQLALDDDGTAPITPAQRRHSRQVAGRPLTL